VWSNLTGKEDDIFLFTRDGKCIRFNEGQVRPMGRNTMGVRGISIGKEDKVIQMDLIPKSSKPFILTIMQNGYGKKTSTEQFPKQGRGGKGVKVAEVTSKTGKIASTQVISEKAKELIVTSKKGQIVKMDIKDIPALSRSTQGVILMRFSKEADTVASATCIDEF
jgi:DNA gyrase subunit A